ncbi:MAG: hypothetical protein HKN10_12870 [Myxococcales bacterium]|nr:hypothetical protein [Myxococcales bacterium]
MTEDAGQSPSPSIGLWVGFGCLGVLVLSCCLLTFWVQSYGMQFILDRGEGTKMWTSRLVLVGALEGTRKTCTDGVISEDALPWFHPNMPSETRNLACSLDAEMLQALTAPERSTTVPIGNTDRATLASELGMDPTLCFVHGTEDLSAIGCFDTDGSSGAIPYQIIDLSLTRP